MRECSCSQGRNSESYEVVCVLRSSAINESSFLKGHYLRPVAFCQTTATASNMSLPAWALGTVWRWHMWIGRPTSPPSPWLQEYNRAAPVASPRMTRAQRRKSLAAVDRSLTLDAALAKAALAEAEKSEQQQQREQQEPRQQGELAAGGTKEAQQQQQQQPKRGAGGRRKSLSAAATVQQVCAARGGE